MDRVYFVDGLQLKKNQFFDDDVGDISAAKPNCFVANRQLDLSPKG